MANWPIQVGGEYRSRTTPESIWSKVTAVDDDRVHFEKWYEGESKPWNAGCLGSDSFRDLHLPEDQSPVPALTKALSSALDFMREHCDPTLPLLSEMQDALDLASKGVAR